MMNRLPGKKDGGQTMGWGHSVSYTQFLVAFWISYYCKCPVALSHPTMGWSAVCDCGIS